MVEYGCASLGGESEEFVFENDKVGGVEGFFQCLLVNVFVEFKQFILVDEIGVDRLLSALCGVVVRNKDANVVRSWSSWVFELPPLW